MANKIEEKPLIMPGPPPPSAETAGSGKPIVGASVEQKPQVETPVPAEEIKTSPTEAPSGAPIPPPEQPKETPAPTEGQGFWRTGENPVANKERIGEIEKTAINLDAALGPNIAKEAANLEQGLYGERG